MAIGRAVVYFAQAAHAFSAGINSRHCTCVCSSELTLRERELSAINGQILIYFISTENAMVCNSSSEGVVVISPL